MSIHIPSKIKVKLLEEHAVTEDEVCQCFFNRVAGSLEDTRADNQTNPPSLWFLAQTDSGRLLKIVYMRLGKVVSIKTAYEPNRAETRIYNKFFKERK